MANVVVVAGPNGAGKSTAAPALLRDFMGIIEFVNADSIAEGLSGFHMESVAIQAGRIMIGRLQSLAQRRRDFAFEATLAGQRIASRLLELRKVGYRVHLLFLWLPSPEMAVARVAERVQQGGHSVPQDVVRRRYHAGLRNFFQLYRDIADSWMLFDNSSLEGPRLIAAKPLQGALVPADEPLWNSIRKEYE